MKKGREGGGERRGKIHVLTMAADQGMEPGTHIPVPNTKSGPGDN